MPTRRSRPTGRVRATSPAVDQQAIAALLAIPPVADELGRRFAVGGHELHLVGGSVRDALLGQGAVHEPAEGVSGTPQHAAGAAPAVRGDLDFATDARPDQVLDLAAGWAEATWSTGIRFGTVGLARAGLRLEVTTYRAESYQPDSRNPHVRFGDSLADDLSRRDFTVNAMAVSLPDHHFTDLYGGLADLAAGVLRTPGLAEDSFGDDPLRMLRAARFVAQLGLRPDPTVVAALGAMSDRLAIISAERIRDELTKLLCAPGPRGGLELMVDTGLADVVMPELPALRMEVDEHRAHKDVYTHTLTVLEQAISREPAGPDLVLRLAALLHDIGKPATRTITTSGRGRPKVAFHHHEVVGAKLARKRLTALRYPKDVIAAVDRLVFLHLRAYGYGQPGADSWSDSAVRRYVTDAGDQLARLHILVRSDCTTRQRAKAAALQAAYDDLERRIRELAAREALERIRPDLDGVEIMARLGIPPGPLVGAARQHLLDLRMEHGPLPHDEAVAALRRWAAERGIIGPTETGSR